MTNFDLPDVLKNARGMRAAKILIDGLAVLSFNIEKRDDPFWEVAYPRKKRHTLTIAIQDLNGDDEPVGDPREIEIDDRVTAIGVRLTKGSVAHYIKFDKGGPRDPHFDRTSPNNNDLNDLGWMVDLADAKGELEHGPVRLLPSHPSRKISLARIRHSLFCTLEPEEKDVKIALRSDNDPDKGKFLGRTNTEIVGVLLATEHGKIEFEFISDPPGLTKIDPLDYDENHRYHIEIINQDHDDHEHQKGFVKGDLYLFYKHVIELQDEKKEKDLWARPARGDKRVSPDGDCHPPDFSGGSLGGLLLKDATEFINRSAARKSVEVTAKKAAKKSTRTTAKKTPNKPTKRTSKKTARKKTARKSTKGRSKKAAKRSTKARSRRTTKNPTKTRSKKAVARRRLRGT